MSPITDVSLTQSGVPADAKVVGDKFSQLSEEKVDKQTGYSMVSDAEKQAWNNKQPSGNYALKSEIPSVPSKTSQLTNDSGYATETYVKNYAQPKGNYLTQHQDISGKANKSGWTPNMIIGTDANGNMAARSAYTDVVSDSYL